MLFRLSTGSTGSTGSSNIFILTVVHLTAAYEMPDMDDETEDTAVLRGESSPTNKSKRKREPSPDAT
eukprot:7417417-Pyramimonas_sp.AAC.1